MKQSPERKKIRHGIVTVVKVLISVSLIYILLQRIGLEQIISQFFTINVKWFIVSLLVFAFSNVLGALQWYMLLRARQIEITWLRVLAFYHVGLFFNNFLIGYIGGDAFRIYDISRNSGKMADAVSTVLLDRFIGFFTLTSLAVIASVIWARHLSSQSAVVLQVTILLIWIFTMWFLFDRRLARKFNWLFRLVIPVVIHQKLRDIYSCIHDFGANRRFLIALLFLSFCIQALRIATHYFAALAMEVTIGFEYFIIFIPLIALAASLPISVGGIGVREQSGVTLFGQLGVASAKVVAFEFLAYVVGIIASLPGGFLFALRKEQIKKRIDG